ncbi:Lipoma HMGIC fusion partner [Paragonimus heterotremus]|uniref:Lipoma HMGIC fusion partner n=1 Tax=Paragonimus heterotremus TaxID=100268 RepID=A0A8J4TI81_9TREM|nr:Lipoma HMGIC fusion partner [Paragonimus heterotremus]
MQHWFWLLWSTMTCLSAILCTIGCILPYWIQGTIQTSLSKQVPMALGLQFNSLPSALGLYRRCVYPVYTDQDTSSTHLTKVGSSERVLLRSNCGHYQFKRIPHVVWRVALIMLMLACGFLVFVSFFLLLANCQLHLLADTLVQRSCQVTLLISGSLVLACCALYPFGWAENSEVHQICGERKSRFDLGRCQIGWGYLITLVGGFLAIFNSALPSLCVRRFTVEDRTNYLVCCATNEHQMSSAHPASWNVSRKSLFSTSPSTHPSDDGVVPKRHITGLTKQQNTWRIHPIPFAAHVIRPTFIRLKGMSAQSNQSRATNNTLMSSINELEQRLPNENV